VDLVTVGTGRSRRRPPGRRHAIGWLGNLKILLDCGAGALQSPRAIRPAVASGYPRGPVALHPDHWGELPMLVYALKYTTVPPRQESS